MKKRLVLALALGLAPPLAIACGDMCVDTLDGYKVTLGGSANFGGFGSGMFLGQEGGVKVEKLGFGNTDLKVNIAGNLCGVNCQEGSFTFAAQAGEAVSVMAGALGTTSGQTVSAINEGAAFSNVTFQFQKLAPSRP